MCGPHPSIILFDADSELLDKSLKQITLYILHYIIYIDIFQSSVNATVWLKRVCKRSKAHFETIVGYVMLFYMSKPAHILYNSINSDS